MSETVNPVEEQAGAKAPADKTVKPEAKAKAPADKLTYVVKHPNVDVDAKGIGMYFAGEEVQIELAKGVFKTTNKAQFDALISEGWQDQTVYPVIEPEKTIHVPNPKKWHYLHPLGDKIDGSSVGVYDADGQEKSIEIKQGRCTVDRHDLAEALEKAGFIIDRTE